MRRRSVRACSSDSDKLRQGKAMEEETASDKLRQGKAMEEETDSDKLRQGKAMEEETATIKVEGLPPTASARDLLAFFSSAVGVPAVVADIPLLRRGWLPRTSDAGEATALVQFDEARGAAKALEMCANGALPPFRSGKKNQLKLSSPHSDIVPRASSSSNRFDQAELLLGNRLQERTMEVLQSWKGVRVEIMPEEQRTRIDIFLEQDGRSYKLEVHFHDIISSCGCKLPAQAASHSSDAILLELMYAPRIYCSADIPKNNRNYKTERYHASTGGLQSHCIWIRQPDFTCNSSFGKSSCLCFKLRQGSSYTQPLESLPAQSEIGDVILLHAESAVPHNLDGIQLHPLLEIPSEVSVPYEVLFQLNSLVHMHKLPPNAVNVDLLKALNVSSELCTKILQRMHRLKSTCYNPIEFVKLQLAEIVTKNGAKSKTGRSSEQKLMKCFRVLITPTKVYLQVCPLLYY